MAGRGAAGHIHALLWELVYTPRLLGTELKIAAAVAAELIALEPCQHVQVVHRC
jgi:hypothetical protein